jgi:hypothetical protein
LKNCQLIFAIKSANNIEKINWQDQNTSPTVHTSQQCDDGKDDWQQANTQAE